MNNKTLSDVWSNYCNVCLYTLEENMDGGNHAETCHECLYNLGMEKPSKFHSRGSKKKPTYEELEAQAATMRNCLEIMQFEDKEDYHGNDYKACPCCRKTEKFVLDSGHDSGCLIGESLSSTAGRDLLDKMQRMNKALELACDRMMDCPNYDHPAPWDCTKRECTEVKCWKDYFMHKAGETS